MVKNKEKLIKIIAGFRHYHLKLLAILFLLTAHTFCPWKYTALGI